MEGDPHRYHEDHIAGKGMNSLSRNNLVYKFIPMPQPMKIPDAKAAVEEWDKLEKIPAWQRTKVRNKNEVIDEARKEGHNGSFCLTDGSLSSQEFGVGTTITKIQRSSGTRGDTAKLKEKHKWAEDKIHLDNARKLRGIYFIDPEDKEFKETIKNARKKLETSAAPAMPCKIMKNCGSGTSNKIKTKLACILEADESTRMRMGNSEPSNHEDHIAGKGENSLQHYNLVHKFIPVPQAMKIPVAKAAVDKEWEKLEKIPAWNLTKVISKKE